MIAILGRMDTPTDAVEDYCRYLGDALRLHGISLVIERVAWQEHGWRAALRSIRRLANGRKGEWVLVQYTALAWSMRGFPWRLLRVLRILKAAGVRIGLVYHDVEPFPGTRWIDWLRRHVQIRIMRGAMDLAQAAVFTVPLEKVSWLEPPHAKAVFIPIGANFPVTDKVLSPQVVPHGESLTVAVFGITGGASAGKEIEQIVEASRFASENVKNLKLVVFGRNSKEAGSQLSNQMNGIPVEVRVLGVLSTEEVVRTLACCDVLLFVRGHISTRRGSAIAGIACGLPVIAAEGPETASPITEAGIAFYSPQRKGDLGDVLLHVLQDEDYRALLAQRSSMAHQRYFSWAVIAGQYTEFLRRPY